MIQANELRVGNLLKDYKHKLQYVEMHTINRYDYTQCKVAEHTGGYVYECSLEDLRPIKLTPEILEKAGFKYNEEKEWFSFQPELENIEYRVYGILPVGTWLLSKGFFSWNSELATVNYVHEFQNIIFYLTKIELPFQL